MPLSDGKALSTDRSKIGVNGRKHCPAIETAIDGGGGGRYTINKISSGGAEMSSNSLHAHVGENLGSQKEKRKPAQNSTRTERLAFLDLLTKEYLP